MSCHDEDLVRTHCRCKAATRGEIACQQGSQETLWRTGDVFVHLSLQLIYSLQLMEL